MKNILALLTAITVVFSAENALFAAYTQDGTPVVYKAQVTVGGSETTVVPFSANMKNISDGTSATDLTAKWNNVSGGVTEWVAANQYIEVKGFATYTDWGIQIYTDNKNASANPKYTGTGDPSGMVNVSKTARRIPMCWRVVPGSYDVATGKALYEGYKGAANSVISASGAELLIKQRQITAGSTYYTVLDDGDTGDEYYPWFFMLDKGTPDVDTSTAGSQLFGSYQPEATFLGSDGFHHAPGQVDANYVPLDNQNDTYYIYLGAKFLIAIPQTTYKTSTLTVEMYHL